MSVLASDYREFLPPPALTEFLVCFWTQNINSSSGYLQRVLPDGCVDMTVMNDVPMVIGPWTESFVASLAPGTAIIGARFRPGIAPVLLGIPASELLNQSLPLREVWAKSHAARFAEIPASHGLSSQLKAMETVLTHCIANAPQVDKIAKAAIEWIARHPHGHVEDLSRCLGLSSRHLQRRFAAAVGYGPKLFQSVLRFQRLLKLASDSPVERNFAQFAAEAEYADQAHMSREVRRFSGGPAGISLQSATCALRLSGLV